MGKALKSRSFKLQLPKFLAREWQNQSYKSILGDCHVYLDIPGEVLHYHVVGDVLTCQSVDHLINNHEEADTKIVFHAKAIDNEKEEGDIIVRASDTDVAIILLYHCNKFKSRLWMDVGTTSKNSRRYICITAISNVLGPQICAALPGFHAFTGSDYTSSFVRKGKVKPYHKMEKKEEAQKAFQCLATEIGPSNDTKKLYRYSPQPSMGRKMQMLR